MAIHGDKEQEERERSIDAFKSGEKDVLVATDVASKVCVFWCAWAVCVCFGVYGADCEFMCVPWCAWGSLCMCVCIGAYGAECGYVCALVCMGLSLGLGPGCKCVYRCSVGMSMGLCVHVHMRVKL